MNKLEIDHQALKRQYDELFTKGLFGQAIEIAQILLKDAKRLHNYEAKADAYIRLMHCYYNLNETENAFEIILKLRLLNEHVQFRLMDYYLEIINAYIYDYEENFELAIIHASKAISIAFELNNAHAIAINRNMLTHCLIKQKETAQALEMALSNEKFIQEKLPNELLLHTQCLHILARAQMAENLTAHAKQTLDKLADSPVIANNKKECSRYLYVYACYYLHIYEYDKALTYLLKVETLAFQNNDIDLLRRIYKEYAFVYAQTGDYKTAFIKMKNYAHLLERAFQTNFSSKMNELSLKQLALSNERLANLDALSNLFNRSYIEQLTNEWLQNYDNTSPICLIVFDVDDFKYINDTSGHLYGDEVIKQIGISCQKVFNTSLTVCARYGGDEFVIVTQKITLDEVINLSEQLFTELSSKKLLIEKAERSISISMGIVSADKQESKRFTELFRLADQALYIAKSKGKKQIAIMTEKN